MFTMNLLSIATSSGQTSIGFSFGGAVFAEALDDAGPGSSGRLLPILKDKMAAVGAKLADFAAVVVDVGPGGFTSIRVGCSLAQGIAFASGVPVYPVCSLDVVAADEPEDKVLAVVDARMGEVYWAEYDRDDVGRLIRHSLGVCAPDALPPHVLQVAVVCGSGVEVYSDLLGRLARPGCALRSGRIPTAVALLDYFHRRHDELSALDPALLQPLYVRNKVAQTVAERRAQGRAN